VTSGEPAAKAAQAATTRIPIVFMGASDPVASGLVKSFARPGGNVTGIADLDHEILTKRMEILHELVPALKRGLLVCNAASEEMTRTLEAHRAAARQRGVTLVEKPVRTEDEARAALTAARKGDVDAVLSPRPLSLNIPGLVNEISTARSLPTMFYEAFLVERGGLVSYSANTYELGRQSARLVDRIIKGTRPADLPVETPTKFALTLNLKLAKAPGITVPQTLMLRADRLIE
jgi:putative ABC transport system substrate-binding protein